MFHTRFVPILLGVNFCALVQIKSILAWFRHYSIYGQRELDNISFAPVKLSITRALGTTNEVFWLQFGKKTLICFYNLHKLHLHRNQAAMTGTNARNGWIKITTSEKVELLWLAQMQNMIWWKHTNEKILTRANARNSWIKIMSSYNDLHECKIWHIMLEAAFISDYQACWSHF